jgi:hypothetical protein
MKAAAKRQVTLLNYGDGHFGHKGAIFKRPQEAMPQSALAHGIDSVVSWKWEMLASTTFYHDHQKYLDRLCGLVQRS